MDQVRRSATSPALNYGEAQSAESTNDFIHKLGIVVKELRETHNALRILAKLGCIPPENGVLSECNDLIAIFVASVKTAQRNRNQILIPDWFVIADHLKNQQSTIKTNTIAEISD